MARPTLNIDLGEIPGEPLKLYALADVANIACGGHAGDARSMREAVAEALRRGIAIAAHPSYPDRDGFGRRRLEMPPEDIAYHVAVQCAGLAHVARRRGATVRMVKPHGALYHAATEVRAIAEAVVRGAAGGLLGGTAEAVASDLVFVGPPSPSLWSGALANVCADFGARFLREGFADRRYAGAVGGSALVARGEPSALLGPDEAAAQASFLARSGLVDTICVHGDGPQALAIAIAVHDALDEIES